MDEEETMPGDDLSERCNQDDTDVEESSEGFPHGVVEEAARTATDLDSPSAEDGKQTVTAGLEEESPSTGLGSDFEAVRPDLASQGLVFDPVTWSDSSKTSTGGEGGHTFEDESNDPEKEEAPISSEAIAVPIAQGGKMKTGSVGRLDEATQDENDLIKPSAAPSSGIPGAVAVMDSTITLQCDNSNTRGDGDDLADGVSSAPGFIDEKEKLDTSEQITNEQDMVQEQEENQIQGERMKTSTEVPDATFATTAQTNEVVMVQATAVQEIIATEVVPEYPEHAIQRVDIDNLEDTPPGEGYPEQQQNAKDHDSIDGTWGAKAWVEFCLASVSIGVNLYDVLDTIQDRYCAAQEAPKRNTFMIVLLLFVIGTLWFVTVAAIVGCALVDELINPADNWEGVCDEASSPDLGDLRTYYTMACVRLPILMFLMIARGRILFSKKSCEHIAPFWRNFWHVLQLILNLFTFLLASVMLFTSLAPYVRELDDFVDSLELNS